MKHNRHIAISSLRKLFMLIVFAMGAALPANAKDVAKLFKSGGSLAGTYSSVVDALKASTEDGMTVQMIDDETITNESDYNYILITLSKAVTLDLNGHTIKTNKRFRFYKGADIQITDNSSDKSGQISTTDYTLFEVTENRLTIREGSFYAGTRMFDTYYSTILIYGGKFNYTEFNVYNVTSDIHIYGGYFKFDVSDNKYMYIGNGYVNTESDIEGYPYMVVPAGAKLTYNETTVYVPSYPNMTIDLKDEESDQSAWLSKIEMMPREEATNTNVTIKKNFANTNWHAFCAPFDFTLTDDLLQDFEFAKIWDTELNTKDNSTFIEFVKLKAGTKITAYTPFLIKAKTTGKQDIVFNGVTPQANTNKSIDCSSIRQKFTFTSVMENTAVNGKYALDSESNALVYVDNTDSQVTPLKFYMQVEARTSGASVQSLKMAMRVIGDETTGINGITDDAATTGDVFNLQGMKVGTSTAGLPAGIYIQNGRKLMVK